MRIDTCFFVNITLSLIILLIKAINLVFLVSDMFL